MPWEGKKWHPGWSVFCLFDGHGDSGHWPAQRAARTLPYFLQASSSCSTMLKQGKIKAWWARGLDGRVF